ncbi:protein UNUSUAL FLORAL ORGANS [Malania oleifera]|uniref:protein UNUSUAL FLORAL ORGANS n=1 Tax=Malania oleifera TaxID=397392 RepID=UPI0025AE2BA8|nr:protein UNUSUAL FLORAL ORGANS [Malania oleifera]
MSNMEAFNTSRTLPICYATTFSSSSSSSSSGSSRDNIWAHHTIDTSPWMDSRIWSRLPQQLMDRVIAFLPPPAFFRARSVCKRWYALLFSNTFLQLYLQLSPPHHCFIFFKHKTPNTYIYNTKPNHSQSGYLFDPYHLAWYRLSFAFVPSGFSPASSSGGLICWVSDAAAPKTLILCNPLVGSMTQLPHTERPRLFPSVGLAVGPSSIDVVVTGDDLTSPYAVKNLTTESFHIDAEGFYSIWGTTSSLPRLCGLESGRMVCADGRFYCMDHSPFSVLAYEVGANRWCKIQAPMRRFLRWPSLVESGGSVVLVAAVEKSKLNVPRSLRLWTMQGGAWAEIERMPQQLYVEFAEAEGNRGFDCVGHGEFIVIVIRGGVGEKAAVMFDARRKRWVWIPACPFMDMEKNVNGGDGEDELRGFPYQPRLATPVTGLLDHLTLPFQPFSG